MKDNFVSSQTALSYQLNDEVNIVDNIVEISGATELKIKNINDNLSNTEIKELEKTGLSLKSSISPQKKSADTYSESKEIETETQSLLLHTQRYRLEKVREILKETLVPFDNLIINAKKVNALVYIGKIRELLDMSLEIISTQDREVGLTLSTIELAIEGDAWHEINSEQSRAIKEVIQKIINKEHIDYFQYTQNIFERNSIKTLPVLP